MEEKRAKTLEALEKFIQSQKDVLARTNSDIERLKSLRKDVVADPPRSMESLCEKLNDPAFRLSDQPDVMPRLPEDIDWSVFTGLDPAPFRAMAASVRNVHAARNAPPPKPLTAPCSLRQFVANTRISVVDPVLTTFRLPDDLAALSSDDEEPDPEEVRRARERDKIRELKKRRIVGDAVFSGLGLRTPVAAVFIRRDQEDESAEVDISMGEDVSTSVAGSEVVPMSVDTPATDVASPASVPQDTAREHRATRKARVDPKASARSNAKAAPKAKARSKVEAQQDDHQDAAPSGPSRGKDGKPKSETYKQAWSVSEQHLLERLLEEIPEGEKNRWAKISKAMNGRRTARQVASRVQKYYEKLKRFGIEVGGSKAGASG
ncbi:hypothetical protein K466DRAFT_535005 [Polyporus arcularius HHB13444]|uniref:Uncharacterized protein n=1 Tax=Polyporus arcularius HHB13444 TaxID=1314778 RepID=A0A5C3PYE0_9APHY|nr:hypothetical protein K466DRAFT_535005 [Polyporus arcularius HHB13444]